MATAAEALARMGKNVMKPLLDCPHFRAWVANTVAAVSGIRPSIHAGLQVSGHSLSLEAAPLLVKRNLRIREKQQRTSMRHCRLGTANLIDFETERLKRAGQ